MDAEHAYKMIKSKRKLNTFRRPSNETAERQSLGVPNTKAINYSIRLPE